MKRNEKILVMVLVAITILVIIVGIKISKRKEKGEEENEKQEKTEQNEEKYTSKLEDGTKINTSEELNSQKIYKNLEISNIQYTEKNGITVLLADVKNIGKTKHEREIVKITILGKDGETISEIKPIIGEIEVGETKKLNASITADVANAKDFKIEEEK